MHSFSQPRATRRSQRRITIVATLAVVSAVLYACSDSRAITSIEDGNSIDLGGGALRTYGAPITLGNGNARTYVDIEKSGTPLEIGVAFSESAMEGLPMDM